MTVIYLASPIDQSEFITIHTWQQEEGIAKVPVPASAEEWDRWGFYKNQAKMALVKLGYECYDPALAWATARQDPAKIQEINDHALDSAEAVLGFLPDGVPTIGTPIELAFAAATRPVMALCGDAGMRSPVLAARGVVTSPLLEWEEGVDRFHRMVMDGRSSGEKARAAGAAYVNEVLAEIVRAAVKWGDATATNTPNQWFGITVEEYLEVVQAWVDWQRDPTHHDSEAVRMELVQAGAMSARLYDSIRYIH